MSNPGSAEQHRINTIILYTTSYGCQLQTATPAVESHTCKIATRVKYIYESIVLPIYLWRSTHRLQTVFINAGEPRTGEIELPRPIREITCSEEGKNAEESNEGRSVFEYVSALILILVDFL